MHLLCAHLSLLISILSPTKNKIFQQTKCLMGMTTMVADAVVVVVGKCE